MAKKKQAERPYEIRQGNCLKLLAEVPAQSVDLVAADAPYNIGRKGYDVYQDDRPPNEYLGWVEQWLGLLYDRLKPQGSCWVAMHDNYVSEVDVAAKAIGFHTRAKVIWVFSFGVNNPKGFTRSHIHWLYYSKHKSKFTFNNQDPDLKVPSARQVLYKDKRAKSGGRLPNDVWLLHPPPGTDYGDTFIESRICGTYKERVPGFDNQMPNAVMERIVRATSKPGDLCLDPFGGTFSTGVACMTLGRRFLGFELSKSYCEKGRLRLEQAYRRSTAWPKTTKK